jgi:hypothetical protein
MNELEKLQQSLAAYRMNLPVLIEYQILNAQVTRAKYNALLKEGFTPEQAVQLCREGR